VVIWIGNSYDDSLKIRTTSIFYKFS